MNSLTSCRRAKDSLETNLKKKFSKNFHFSFLFRGQLYDAFRSTSRSNFHFTKVNNKVFIKNFPDLIVRS